MITLQPVTLEGSGIWLEPMSEEHHDGLVAAASDGTLWDLWFTVIPKPDGMRTYIADALAAQRSGTMLPWVVSDVATNTIIGTTRYHDVQAAMDRVEIGY